MNEQITFGIGVLIFWIMFFYFSFYIWSKIDVEKNEEKWWKFPTFMLLAIINYALFMNGLFFIFGGLLL